jgi:hypothetical protein
VNKFLSYGLIDTLSESAASTIDKVANAVTHTRFVGTNANDDEVVLMRILQVKTFLKVFFICKNHLHRFFVHYY